MKEAGRKKIFWKKYKGAILVFCIFFLLVILIFVKFYFFKEQEKNPEKKFLFDFCSEKCGEKDYYYFENVSEFSYIKCACVVKTNYGDGKYAPVASVDSAKFYFDSQTFEQISKGEVALRENG